MAAHDEASGNWLIQPPPETADLRSMSIEEWRAAVERWCQQLEADPKRALETGGSSNLHDRPEVGE